MELQTLSTRDLLKEYNIGAAYFGETIVKRFPDKKAALRRTKVMVGRHDEATAKEAPKTTAPRTTRAKRYVFKPEADIKGFRVPVGAGKPSLRQQAVPLLLKGATEAQVDDLVREFDKARDVKTDPKTLSRRTYGLIRLVHYYLGYGLREETNEAGETVIFAYTDPADTDPKK